MIELHGRKVLYLRPISDLKGDEYLTVVLCEWNGKLVNWVYNSQTKAFFWGHYFEMHEAEKAKAFFDNYKKYLYMNGDNNAKKNSDV